MSYTPRYTNLHQLLQQSVERFAHKPVFGTRTSTGWQWTTYGTFGQLVRQAAAGLSGLGVGAGDRVACISNNRLEWAIGAYATYSLGATYVPMYEAQLDAERQYILHDSGAKVCLVANAAVDESVGRMREQLPELEHTLCFDGTSFDALLEQGKQNPVSIAPPKDDDIASFIYTSGTTGKPKGVKLTHHNLAANVSACLDIAPLQGEERCLAFLPWAHVFGGTVELNTLIAYGGAIAICDDTTKLVDYLPEVKPTLLFAVPRVWNRIYDGVQKQVASQPKPIQVLFEVGMRARSKEKRGQSLTLPERLALPLAAKLVFSKIVARFGGELRFAFSGAAALSKDVGEFIDNLGIQVYEGYGMTESSGGTTGNNPDAIKLGTVGKPLPGVEVKLDMERGTQPGEGEIIIYGTGVMAGYHNLPEASAEVFTEDGGLRSGDLGFLDDEGFLSISGRVKEIYKLANGKYIAPAPLEEKVQLSAYISQCVIYGDNQPHNVALIIPDMVTLSAWGLRHGVTDSSDLLSSPKVRTLLAREIERASDDFKGFERIRDFILSSEEMTPDNGLLTPTMKVKRAAVMARYGAELEALYH